MPAYKDDKTKTWYVKFRYKNWKGESKHTTKRGFSTKKDALNYEYNFKANSTEQTDMTVAVLIEKYLEDKKINVKYNTYESINETIKNHILPYLGRLKLTELTPAIMRRWQNEILKKGLKSGTLRVIDVRCSTLLNYAVKYYGLKQNPLHIMDRIGKVEHSLNFWELSEYKQFIKVVDNPLYKICFQLLFYTGMRVGELLALNAGDFDFESNKISITKTKIKRTNAIGTPKTSTSVRTIDMPSEVMQLAKDYISTLNYIPSPLIQTSSATLSYNINKYAKKANIKSIRIHDLRHSYVSMLIHDDVPLPAISKSIGHKSADITLKVYSHMYDSINNRLVSSIKNAFYK